MLDLLGSGYVIEHCVTAFRLKKEREALAVYVTDMLRSIVMGLGAKGVKRWYELIHPPKVDNRAPEDIVKDITAKAGLKVVNKDERNEPDGDDGD